MPSLKRLHFYEARLSAYEAFCGDAAKYEAPLMRYEAKPFQASFRHFFLQKKMAEEVGFEPTEGRPSAVFKTAALNHSTILPRIYIKCHTKAVLSSFIAVKNRFFLAEAVAELVKSAMLWHIIENIVFLIAREFICWQRKQINSSKRLGRKNLSQVPPRIGNRASTEKELFL